MIVFEGNWCSPLLQVMGTSTKSSLYTHDSASKGTSGWDRPGLVRFVLHEPCNILRQEPHQTTLSLLLLLTRISYEWRCKGYGAQKYAASFLVKGYVHKKSSSRRRFIVKKHHTKVSPQPAIAYASLGKMVGVGPNGTTLACIAYV